MGGEFSFYSEWGLVLKPYATADALEVLSETHRSWIVLLRSFFLGANPVFFRPKARGEKPILRFQSDPPLVTNPDEDTFVRVPFDHNVHFAQAKAGSLLEISSARVLPVGPYLAQTPAEYLGPKHFIAVLTGAAVCSANSLLDLIVIEEHAREQDRGVNGNRNQGEN